MLRLLLIIICLSTLSFTGSHIHEVSNSINEIDYSLHDQEMVFALIPYF